MVNKERNIYIRLSHYLFQPKLSTDVNEQVYCKSTTMIICPVIFLKIQVKCLIQKHGKSPMREQQWMFNSLPCSGSLDALSCWYKISEPSENFLYKLSVYLKTCHWDTFLSDSAFIIFAEFLLCSWQSRNKCLLKVDTNKRNLNIYSSYGNTQKKYTVQDQL